MDYRNRSIRELLGVLKELDGFQPDDSRYRPLFYAAKGILHHSISHSDRFVGTEIGQGAKHYVREKLGYIQRFLGDGESDSPSRW